MSSRILSRVGVVVFAFLVVSSGTNTRVLAQQRQLDPAWFAGTVRLSAPDVTPPTVLRRAQKQTLPVGLDSNLRGTVVPLDARIGTDGTVENLRVFEYGGRVSVPRLDEEAAAAAKLWQFRPARQNGVPVPMIVRIEIQFE